MSSECASDTCDTGTMGCSTSTCGSSSGTCSACQTACGGDPIVCATAMWQLSFFQALKAAQMEVLKAKIQKAWGQKMDKAADAVLEAMGVQWQSMLAQAGAKASLSERLRTLWQEDRKSS